jgi:hypothetical protein
VAQQFLGYLILLLKALKRISKLVLAGKGSANIELSIKVFLIEMLFMGGFFVTKTYFRSPKYVEFLSLMKRMKKN